MHKEQKEFCESVKARFPEYFNNVDVLDVGSLDINGNNRYLFTNNSFYTGLDIGAGRNVDVVKPVHEYKPDFLFGVIISTEMLEHDKFKFHSLERMYKLLRPGGLMLITAATVGRTEHGTHNNEPESSPFTNEFYEAVTLNDFTAVYLPNKFSLYEISIDVRTIADIRFVGIKK